MCKIWEVCGRLVVRWQKAPFCSLSPKEVRFLLQAANMAEQNGGLCERDPHMYRSPFKLEEIWHVCNLEVPSVLMTYSFLSSLWVRDELVREVEPAAY